MSITQHGVTFETAYVEAAAIANTNRAMLDCYSLSHPLMPQTLYFVVNGADFTATVPGDGVQTFIHAPASIERPEESDQASSPESVIAISNISGDVLRLLKTIRGSLVPLKLTSYVYSSTDTSGPVVNPPQEVFVTRTEVDEKTARLTCTFGDPGNTSFPALTFKRDEYTTLDRLA